MAKGSPLGGSFSWTRSSSGPLHPGGLYLGWIEPSTALMSRRGRVVSAWGGNRTRMVVATTGPSCHLDYLTNNFLQHRQKGAKHNEKRKGKMKQSEVDGDDYDADKHNEKKKGKMK
ncbi:hypothetical protein HID58_048827 [Brassica napus]|uniref:Uncharacterized protein n=1 Tax=Brassica napus TaxID=3708 RepID=A0ABQ8B382_BRANA|nr:hypothetical protein HID58_048827 [Brassica napus]